MDYAIPHTDEIYSKNITYNIYIYKYIYYKNFLYISGIGYFKTVKLLIC